MTFSAPDLSGEPTEPVLEIGGQRQATAGQLGDIAAQLLAGQRATWRHTSGEVADHA